MNKAHFIVYVSNQGTSADFYEKAFGMKPTLNVPGMTEFKLNDGAVFGLMPENGIKKLLGDKIKNPADARGIPRAELYWIVPNLEEAFQRALKAGGVEIGPVQKRNWGQFVGYFADPDGHVIAFASDSL